MFRGTWESGKDFKYVIGISGVRESGVRERFYLD